MILHLRFLKYLKIGGLVYDANVIFTRRQSNSAYFGREKSSSFFIGNSWLDHDRFSFLKTKFVFNNSSVTETINKSQEINFRNITFQSTGVAILYLSDIWIDSITRRISLKKINFLISYNTIKQFYLQLVEVINKEYFLLEISSCCGRIQN